MTIHKRFLLFLSFLLIVLLMFFTVAISTSAIALAYSNSSTDADPTLQAHDDYTSSEINDILSGLNDSQVRQLLKQELSKNSAEEPNSLLVEIPGPRTFLSSMLSSLLAISSESKNRSQRMFKGLPKIFPDLYKVFLTL